MRLHPTMPALRRELQKNDKWDLYRSRPGGSAEGGVEGVAGSEPEFAETLLGAG